MDGENDNLNSNVIQGDEDILNLSVSDEIVVKDEDGSFKVLIGGKTKKLDDEKGMAGKFASADKQVFPKASATGEVKQTVQRQGLISEEPLSEQLAPPPPLPWEKKDGAAFYFDTEDEEEVQKIATDKGLYVGTDFSVKPDINSVVDMILQESMTKLNLAQINKVRSIITSFLQHIRTQAETREMLKSQDASGAGLTESVADKLIMTAAGKFADLEKSDTAKQKPSESELDKILSQAEIYKIEDKSPAAEFSKAKLGKQSSDIPNNLSIGLERGDTKNRIDDIFSSPVEMPEAVDHQATLAEEVMAKHPEYSEEPKVVKDIETLVLKKSAPTTTDNESGIKKRIVPPVQSKPRIPPSGIKYPKPIIKRPTVEQSSRPKMDDVKPSIKARGPIEQIRFLNLTELRRQRDDSLLSISEIKTKIDELEEDSFAKKVEAIKAWRQSPLYSLYVQIGRASMESSKSIREVIEKKEKMNIETLTLAEFEKIMDLNKELRY